MDNNDFLIKDGILEKYVGSSCHVIIPKGVTKIGDYAFNNYRETLSVVIPDGVRSIDMRAFNDCSGLVSVTIPKSVITIGNGAFKNCIGLVRVNIPDGVMIIGDEAFSGCNRLASVTLPDSVRAIGEEAFSECYSLTKITIPNGVKRISNGMFYYCRNLVRITIPNGVTSIGNHAFHYCKRLADIKLPDSLESIGEDAFEKCKSITDMTIPDSVTNIGCSAFIQCDGLSDKDGFVIIKNALYDYCGDSKHVVIPSDVTRIERQAFEWSDIVKEISIPKTVKRIEAEAFYDKCTVRMSLKCPIWDVTLHQKSILSEDGSVILFENDSGETVAKVVLAIKYEPEEVQKGAFLSISQNNNAFDFEAYDAFWERLSIPQNKMRVALARIQYPYALSDEMEAVYRAYLERVILSVGIMLVGEGNFELIRFICEELRISIKSLRRFVNVALEEKKTEIAAFLMNEINKRRQDNNCGFKDLYMFE